jgi:hypothetical protein
MVPVNPKSNQLARPGGAEFNPMWQRHDDMGMGGIGDMFGGMDKRANKMLENFGMPMMKMRDPFKDDPFFSGGGNDIFGQMDSMMK